MNLSAPPPSAPPRAPSNADTAICRRDDAPPQNPRETFEYVLQAKRQAPRTDPTPDAAICHCDDALPHNPRDAFEYVLHAKRQAPCDEQEDTPSDEAAAAATSASIAPAQSLGRALAVPAGAGAGVVDTATGDARAAIQTALTTNPGPHVTPICGTEPAAVWEASVRGPQHLTIDVRAERFTSHGAPPSWGLTIGSPALGVELLARHAPRLNERLRKHGVELDHVRIESSDDEVRR